MVLVVPAIKMTVFVLQITVRSEKSRIKLLYKVVLFCDCEN